MFKDSHEPRFQEKLINYGGLNIQASKNKFGAKGKGKKTTSQNIVEVTQDVTMLDY